MEKNCISASYGIPENLLGDYLLVHYYGLEEKEQKWAIGIKVESQNPAHKRLFIDLTNGIFNKTGCDLTHRMVVETFDAEVKPATHGVLSVKAPEYRPEPFPFSKDSLAQKDEYPQYQEKTAYNTVYL